MSKIDFLELSIKIIVSANNIDNAKKSILLTVLFPNYVRTL